MNQQQQQQQQPPRLSNRTRALFNQMRALSNQPRALSAPGCDNTVLMNLQQWIKHGYFPIKPGNFPRCDNTVLMNLQQWINCILPILSTLVVISVSRSLVYNRNVIHHIKFQHSGHLGESQCSLSF
jgi:hypothetical protein